MLAAAIIDTRGLQQEAIRRIQQYRQIGDVRQIVSDIRVRQACSQKQQRQNDRSDNTRTNGPSAQMTFTVPDVASAAGCAVHEQWNQDWARSD